MITLKGVLRRSPNKSTALLQSKILEPVVVNSVHTCRHIFPFFFFSFFLLLFALLANVLSAFTQQPLPLRLQVSWKWIGHKSFPEGSFFLFVSIDFDWKKGPCYHFIDDVRFRVCAEAGLKESFFFFAPKVLSLGARLRPSWKKMRPEKWRPGSVRKSLRLTQKRFFEPCYTKLYTKSAVSESSIALAGFNLTF